MKKRPSIFIAMPLFEGWEHVAHTLETIKNQTYENYRVLISVDAGDQRSFDACAAFLSDSRFNIVIHEDHLGWEGNINYLAQQLDEDFFCYWQHDDYCDPVYLETLVSHADDHPEASAIYCDMQVFGEIGHFTRQPSVTGTPLERVLSQVEKPHVAAIRCLIRAEAMRASLPIKLATTWLLALARAGELHRVPELLYYRRIRPEALEFTMPQKPASEMWRGSLDWGLGVLENIYPLISESGRGKTFAMVVDRIMTDQYRGKVKYNFESTSHALKLKFIHQLLLESKGLFGFDPYEDMTLQGDGLPDEEINPAEKLIFEALRTESLPSDDAIDKEFVPPVIKKRN